MYTSASPNRSPPVRDFEDVVVKCCLRTLNGFLPLYAAPVSSSQKKSISRLTLAKNGLHSFAMHLTMWFRQRVCVSLYHSSLGVLASAEKNTTCWNKEGVYPVLNFNE